MTATAYAKQHDLGPSSLWRWSRRLPVAPPPQAHALPKLVPIEFASRRATIEPPRASVELELASGHLLRLRGRIDPDLVGALVAAIERATRC